MKDYSDLHDSVIRYWNNLTRVLRVLLGVVLLSVGAWLGGFFVPLKDVPPSYFDHQYEISLRIVQRLGPDLPLQRRQRIAYEAAEHAVAEFRREDRDRVQKPATMALFAAALLGGFVLLIRSNPDSWNSITRIPIIGEFVPCGLPMWQISVETEFGTSEVLGNRRSLYRAKLLAKGARQSQTAREIHIQWDYKLEKTYTEYSSQQRFF